MEAQEVANLLNAIVSAWDQVVLRHGVEKIKTIGIFSLFFFLSFYSQIIFYTTIILGDIYMAVCGCPEPVKNHASKIIQCAAEMILVIQDFNITNGTNIHVRVGINSGPVVAGVIGKTKVMYFNFYCCIDK